MDFPKDSYIIQFMLHYTRSIDEEMKVISNNATLVVNAMFALQYKPWNDNNKSGIMKLDLPCTPL